MESYIIMLAAGAVLVVVVAGYFVWRGRRKVRKPTKDDIYPMW